MQALYPLLNAHADDFGRISCDAFTVKHEVFPTSPRSEAEFERALQAMHDAGLIRRYRVQGEEFAEIIKFDEHQTGLHKRTKSRLPPPPDGNVGNPANLPGVSANPSENPSEEKGREEKGREEDLARERATPPTLTLTRGQLRQSVGDLVALWNEDIPEPLKPVAALLQSASENRIIDALRSRPDLDWWRTLIADVRASDWLSGRVAGKDGKSFVADLWWVLAHVDEIASGRYANRAAARPANGASAERHIASAAATRAHVDAILAAKAERRQPS